ncbi:MAG: YidC/Oxa1 family insertase periplasmic-domain containing protein [Opitutaceae bacterium]|jgi:YidC/Oxa1 family membrane protein insertase|nr:YidC/Oxa1 family insertase periplasmic-domain containing protein [Opitutaceae bacterium]
MDKKNLTLGILFMIAAFATLIIGAKMQPPPAPAPAAPLAGSPAVEGGTAPAPTTTLSAPSVSNSALASLATNRSDAEVTTLSNEFVTVRLTDFGGAIRDVAFKKYPATQGSPEAFVFNERHAAPLLALGELAGLGPDTRFTLVSASANEVIYRAVFENRLEITRRYVLPSAASADSDPYRIRHETTVRNLGDATVPLPRLALELGTTALVSANDTGLYLNVATYDGEDAEVVERADLEPGFLSRFGIGSSVPKPLLEQTRPIVWAAVKNQFFASIYTPDQPGQSVAIRRVELPPLSGSSLTTTGITAVARFDQPALAPGASHIHGGHLYVGPKEYTRLANSDLFRNREDKVMQFDRYFFNRIFLSGLVAPLLNKLMVWTHSWTGNWGIAIILMTILLKFISVPFTLAASKSAKRMAKLSEPMKAIREKYKDNPKKLNEATLALFKEHKVNPAGGCIPILITIPLFVGFFAMLMGTAELRFQGFLWAHDLSAPDTIWRVPGLGLPLNIMPLLMGATMIVQMRLTPQPTTMEGPQVMIMKLMPWVFTLICYNFAAALALYSTINGLFTIIQQLLVNKYSNDDEPAAATATTGGRSGKPLKNVTPAKKK